MHFITVQTVANKIFKNAIHILIIISILFQITQAEYIIQYPIENLSNINCHKEVIEGDFPSADTNKLPPLKSIFFVETSCKGGINSRQACSIESAARAHPKWTINILFAGPVSIHTQRGSTIVQLQKYKNIKFLRIHVTEYGKETPLEGILSSNILNSSGWSVMHSADVLRYLILYKWGGVYLDLDVMVIKPLEGLARNWVAKQSEEYIASGLVSVWRNSRGRAFAKALISYIKENFNFDQFDSLGPTTMMEVLGDLCTTRDVTKLTSATCSGIAIYGPKYFYPIDYPNWRRYFQNEEPDLKDCYTHHTWNYISRYELITQHSMYAKLAGKFCPSIFHLYNSINKFGF